MGTINERPTHEDRANAFCDAFESSIDPALHLRGVRARMHDYLVKQYIDIETCTREACLDPARVRRKA